jgi:hypothetical protein
MKKFATLLAVLALVGFANAETYSDLGYSEDTIVVGDPSDQCAGEPIYNHDGSFETGVCWQYGGVMPPYYGAWGEAYDLGMVNVECGLYWLTQTGYYMGQCLDAYVWEGGVNGPPSGVLCLEPCVTGLQIGFWPTITMHEIEIGCCVDGEFTVGYWGDFVDQACGWYVAYDQNGFGGYPWTCFAPGAGYPTGWGDPNLMGYTCQSLGLGLTATDDPSPAESQTWGSIKSLFE